MNKPYLIDHIPSQPPGNHIELLVGDFREEGDGAGFVPFPRLTGNVVVNFHDLPVLAGPILNVHGTKSGCNDKLAKNSVDF